MSSRVRKNLKFNNLLLLSLLLNLLSASLLVIFIANRGGISYLRNKLSQTNNYLYSVMLDKKISNPDYETDHYLARNRHFRVLPQSKTDILMVGDSLTEGGDWVELLDNGRIRNRGISGDTIEGVINRIEEHIAGKPQKVFIMIGTNDLWRGEKNADIIIDKYRQILNKIKQNSPATIIYIQSLLPVNQKHFIVDMNNATVQSVNRQLRMLVKEFSLIYIDLYPKFITKDNHLNSEYTEDGVHLNDLGYSRWAEAISPYIN